MILGVVLHLFFGLGAAETVENIQKEVYKITNQWEGKENNFSKYFFIVFDFFDFWAFD